MDVVVEYMVQKKSTAKDLLLKLSVAAGSLLLLFIALLLSQVSPFLTAFGLIICIGVVYFAYRYIASLDVEYEYTIVNGEMDIDKIIARRKRKRLLTVKLTSFEQFGKFRPSDHEQVEYDSRVYSCEDPKGENAWYAVFSHRELGNTLLVFTPNDRMMEALNVYVPRGARK